MKVFFMGTAQIHRLEKIMYNKIGTSIESLEKNKFLKLFEDMKNILNSEIIYGTFFGLFSKRNLIYLIIAKLFRKKVICHWIGTDVLIALENPKKTLFIQKFIDLNLSGSKQLKEELETVGIKSMEEHIILNDIDFNIEEMPSEHSALAYLPTEKVKFYGGDYIKQLAKDFPNIKFYIVANENKDEFKDYENIINLGRVSLEKMEEVYQKISILIRIVEHDGLSLMLMEALAKGKEVIYSYDFPYTYKSNSYISLKENFIKIIVDKPKKNIEGAKYVTENFKVENYINNLLKYFENISKERKY